MSGASSRQEIPRSRGNITVGVHLGIDSLRAVEVNRGRIVQWIDVPYPEDRPPGSKEFPAFLRSCLAEFYSVLRHPETWVVGPTPSLQMRFLSLPRVRLRQVSNLVYWTFRKEIPFDAAQTVFDYAVEGSDPALSGPAKKMDVTAYTVARADAEALVELFDRAGIHLDGIVLPSFAMRNLFRNQPSGVATGNAMELYVGDDSSSIMFFKGRNVVSHRLFKTGLNVLLDVVRDRHPDWSPAKAFQVIRAAFAAGAPATGIPEGSGDEEATLIRESVRATFGRLIQQVERSMSAYMVGREEEIKDVYVAGPVAVLTPLVEELGSKLGVNSHPLELFRARQVADQASAPWGPEEAGALSIALGAALSDRAQTPNLMYNYVKREKEASGVRAKKLLAGFGIVGVTLMLLASHLVDRLNERTRGELEGHLAQLRQYVPRTDRALIQTLADKVALNSLLLKKMARRSLPAAALNLLAQLTPADIRLISLVMESGKPAAEGGRPAPKKPAMLGAAVDPEMRLRIEGMVLGEIGAQESKLASYQLRLENSELFEGATLVRSESGLESETPVLLFGLDMRMEELVGAPPAPPPPEGGFP